MRTTIVRCDNPSCTVAETTTDRFGQPPRTEPAQPIHWLELRVSLRDELIADHADGNRLFYMARICSPECARVCLASQVLESWRQLVTTEREDLKERATLDAPGPRPVPIDRDPAIAPFLRPVR